MTHVTSASTEVVPRSARLRARWQRASPYVFFVLAFAFLNAFLNARYPGRENAFWYLVPSVDVVGLLAGYAVLGWRGRRVPTALHVALIVFLVFVRLFRIGEGIETRYLFRTLNLWSDVQLVPDLARLIYTTTPSAKLVLGVGIALAFSIGGIAALSYSLRYSERFLSKREHAALFAIIVAAFALISPLNRRPEHPDHYYGAFGSSVLPRLAEEADFMLHVYGYRAQRLSEIGRVRDELATIPSNLKQLGGRNVLLFVVESYGVTVFARPLLEARLRTTYDAFEASLRRHGFTAASGVLDSPTYGGSSWLAHATLATGVRTSNQFEFSLLKASSPRTIAEFFGSAGYRTVLVQPATTRILPGDDYQRFEQLYFKPSFGYEGPTFGFAPMPDQYVIDFIDRHERGRADRPKFIEFALVSSHFAWDQHAPMIDDWASIENGAIFGQLDKIEFPHGPAHWADGYAHSIAYDLEVLRRYLAERITDESLIIVLGDHQPVTEVTLNSPDTGVPIHVISRHRAFVEKFLARGYTPGMRPDIGRSRAGMQGFLPAFLRDFSTP